MRILIVSVLLTLVIVADPVASGNTRIIEFSEIGKSTIIHMVNNYRNIVAYGHYNQYTPADRMATVVWSLDLARLAETNLELCILVKGTCHGMSGNQWIGQKFAKYSRCRAYYEEINVIILLVNGLFAQKEFGAWKILDSFKQSNPTVSGFAKLMQDHCTTIGCATAERNTHLMEFETTIVRVFGFGNVVGQPVYHKSTSTSGGRGCSIGQNTQYPSLCSKTETYDLSALSVLRAS